MQTKLISIYTDFIADFEAKMDPLRLAQIGMAVVEKYSTPDDAIAFVEKIQDKVKMNNEALCLCKVGGIEEQWTMISQTNYSKMETNTILGDGGKSEASQDAAAERDQVDHWRGEIFNLFNKNQLLQLFITGWEPTGHQRRHLSSKIPLTDVLLHAQMYNFMLPTLCS